MKTIAVLLKLRLRALLSSFFTTTRKKGKKVSPFVLVLFGFLMLYVFCVFGFLFGMIAMVLLSTLQASGSDISFYFAALGAAAFLLCVFGSVFTTQHELYEAKDNELLLSMPVKPTAILVSRMLMLFVINLLFAAVVLIPGFLVYWLLAAPGVGNLLAFVFFALLIPVFALAFSCLLGWLLALLSSRLKRKNLITTLFLFLFFGGYMYVMLSLDAFMEGMELYMPQIVETLSPYLLIFWWIGYALGQGNFWYGLAFAALCILAFAGVLWVLSRTYFSVMTTNRGGVRYVYREKRTKQSGIVSALIRREIRHFFGNAMYIFNAGLGLFLAPILGIALLLKQDSFSALMEIEEFAFILPILPALIGGAFCVMASMVTISAPSVSLEGKSLWLVQSMPLHPKTVLHAKAYAHSLLCLPFFLVTSLLCAYVLHADPLTTLALCLLPVAANTFCAYLGVVMNMWFPKFDFVNETAAVKSGLSVLFTMLGMMVIGIAAAAMIAVLSFMGLPAFLAMFLGALVFALASLGLHAYLAGPGARRFARL